MAFIPSNEYEDLPDLMDDNDMRMFYTDTDSIHMERFIHEMERIIFEREEVTFEDLCMVYSNIVIEK